MANYFSLRDGLLADTTTYGISMSGAEKTSNTSAYTLTTSDSWSTVLTGSSADVVDSIAVHLSSRATNPVGVLSAQIDQYAGYITKAGTTDSTGSPFGEGVDGSIYLNGTASSYLRSTSPVPLSGDYTIELWIYPTVLGSTTNRIFIESWGNNSGWQLYYRYTPGASIAFYINSSVILQDPSSSRLTVNNWHHVAVTRQLSATRLFVNGVQVASAVNATNINPTQPLNIGTQSFTNTNPFIGYVSNARVVNGTALYTSNFTPTGPLTLVDNTTFLYQTPYTNAYKSSSAYLNTLVGTYPISSFTSYGGPTSTTSYPLNWQLLKLSSPTRSGVFRLNLKTSDANQLSLIGTNTVSGVDYNIMCIKDSFISSPPINLYIGNVINGFSTENRTITASTTSLNDVFIYKGGTLQFSTNSTTLTVSGSNGIQIGGEGTLQIGTSSNPVPKDITHQIVLSGIGVSNGGRLDVYGAYKIPYTKLTAPSNGGSVGYQVTDPVSGNWSVGDTIVFTPNTTIPSSYEDRIINAFQNVNAFSSTANAFAHTVLDYVPNIANLTRNVKIFGDIILKKGSISNINNAEMRNSNLYIAETNNFALSGCSLSGSYNNSPLLPSNDFKLPYFNGTNSNMYFAANANYNMPAGTDYTFETWFQVESVSNSLQVICIYCTASVGSDANNTFICSIDTTNKVYFTTASNLTYYGVISDDVIVPKKWYHLAAVARSSRLYLYIDGKQQKSTATQITWNAFTSTRRVIFGVYPYEMGLERFFKGIIGPTRLVKGLALYTTDFTPPNEIFTEITGENISTILLTLNTPELRDISNNPVTTANLTNFKNISPFDKLENLYISNNIFYKHYRGLDLLKAKNSTFSNNLILSSSNSNIFIENSEDGVLLYNNISVGSPTINGITIKNNINYNNILDGNVTYNNRYGMEILNCKSIINNSINNYNLSAGVYIDGTNSQLSSTTFSTITASNNRTVGFLVSGNSVNPLTPITLNINGLVANDNLSAGFEGYSISGNLSSLELNRNGFYGMKTSIGNAPTTIDGVTALTNNVSYVSAAIGILSATNYHPTVIKNANVGKSVAASTFGAAISLDSTKFSQFVVHNSTVSGGSSDFQLRTTRGQLEGSYLISNTNVGNLPVGAGITTSNYQPDVLKTTGFAFTNMNNASGYNVTYLAAGTRQIDSTVNISSETSPSERLTPKSATIKLRSGSKFVALDAGQSTSIGVYIRKSTVASNGVAYNGTAPRLILKRNSYMGINSDIVMDQLDTTSENFLKLSGVTPAVTDSGVLEFYVDCDGTQGWINIDNWTGN